MLALGPFQTPNPDTYWREEAGKQSLFSYVLLWVIYLFIYLFFLMQNVVRWLTARAKWLENTLVLFRRCEDRAPFTGLILRCLLVWPWQNSPRVHSSVTSLQKRKWEECVKTNFQGRVRVGGREKEALIVIFHCAILSLEDQKRHSCTSIIQTENAEMKSNNQVFCFFLF